MIAEEKTFNAKVSYCFTVLIKDIFEPALRNYCFRNDIDFRGYHIIIFERTNPDDGKIWLDNKEISKDELKKFLSMEN